jgi:polysaccharide chain length determinant protein (PEP-CTERM system associated)
MEKNFIKDLLLALKYELIRFRLWCVLLLIVVSFAALSVGFLWPKTFTTSAVLFAEETSIIEPLMRGRAAVTDIDRSVRAREVIYTRQIMEAAGQQAGLVSSDMSQTQKDVVVRRIRGGLHVITEARNVFRVGYSASDPDTSFHVLNAIVNVFIEDTIRRRREESLGAFNFIDAQVESYKRQLELAEDRLKEFRAHNLDGTEASVTARLGQLRNELENLTISIEETQSRIASTQEQLGSETRYLQARGKVDGLRQRRQVMAAQLEQLRLSYQENYPDVVSLREQIKELDASIAELHVSGEVYTGADSIENPLYEELRKQLSIEEVNLRAQKRRMQSLINLQEEEFSRAQRIAASQAALSELTRDYNVTRDVYEEMLQRKESARLSMTLDIEGQGVSYKIQEPAAFPLSPTGLRYIHFAILGPILGMLAPIGLLVMYIMLDPRLRSAHALHEQMPAGVALLGVIPHYHTPLGERLVRKDMLLLTALWLLAMGAYVALAMFWYDIRG